MSTLTKTTRLTVLLLFVFCAMPLHPALAAEPAVGTVSRIQATAMIDGEEVAQGAPVFQGSTLSTTENGRLEVIFNDKTKLLVGGASTFIVDDFAYNPEKDKTVDKAFFNLVKGSFRMITSQLIDASPDSFGVKTPLASIGIRGTDFWGGYLSPIEIDIVMLEGKGVIITSMGGMVEISEPGVGVSVPDPTKHPQGYAKALLPPEQTKWSAEKIAHATATVSFD